MKITRSAAIAAIILALLLILPVSAVMLEETYKGQVSRIDENKKMFTMQVDTVYNGKEWVVYSKTSLKNRYVEGIINNPDFFADVKQGDKIEATIMGGAGGEWIIVGKIGSTSVTESPIIASYGDPSRLVSPYYKGYTISFEGKPDCDSCEGSTCPALSAVVTVSKDKQPVETKEMIPGERHVFGWTSDYQYVLKVIYNRGEAPSSLCPETGMITGPQAISDFTIYDTQRSTILESEIGAINPEETKEIKTETPTEIPTLEETQTQVPPTQAPTKSGPAFAWLIGAMAVITTLFVCRKKL
ncbi:hypothetical protein F1737_10870 [Methanoplanus sp. FWC-SCC4]|uniref:Uncharacterized protein n=1 Tax=Methanochimaera problematica TaxID=2609417 RepID=A0AA97I562_9EURY|nr:hypothetical protein [Methanoplanus sp. FWC-SCC4]WOF17144.1 hypothetical protein F1737_10870 [Methanoplanus sp. FWC-SCC4]